MFVLDSLKWWYTAGWSFLAKKNVEQLRGLVQTFSILELLRTLFSPFRQTLTGKAEGTLGDKLRAFVDNIVSRCIGLIVRTIIILTGFLFLLLRTIFTIVSFVVWPIIPLLPIVSIVLTAKGWVIIL